MVPDTFSAPVISARFRRHSRGPRASATALFDELACSVSGPLLACAGLRGNELPVLASIVSPADWLLVSNSRVLVSREGRITSLEHADIMEVNVDIEACAADAQVETYHLAYILLETYSGGRWSIHVQPGGGYLGVLSVLKMFAEQNWRARRSD